MASKATQEAGVETFVERRRSPRAPVVVRVEYSTVDALFTEFASNVNEGGMFVETDSPPEIDSLVSLQFSLPGSDQPIKVSGRVVRITEARLGQPAGMGIEFDELEPEARTRINEVVQGLRTRMP